METINDWNNKMEEWINRLMEMDKLINVIYRDLLKYVK